MGCCVSLNATLELDCPRLPPSSDINYSYQRQNECVANVDKMQAKVGNSVPLGEVDTIIILDKNVEYYWGHQNEAKW